QDVSDAEIKLADQQDKNATPHANAIPALQKAVAVAGASPEAKVHALLMLANAEMGAAAEKARDLNAKQAEVYRHIGRIDVLGSQIASNNALIAGYQKLNPADKTIPAVEDQI